MYAYMYVYACLWWISARFLFWGLGRCLMLPFWFWTPSLWTQRLSAGWQEHKGIPLTAAQQGCLPQGHWPCCHCLILWVSPRPVDWQAVDRWDTLWAEPQPWLWGLEATRSSTRRYRWLQVSVLLGPGVISHLSKSLRASVYLTSNRA